VSAFTDWRTGFSKLSLPKAVALLTGCLGLAAVALSVFLPWFVVPGAEGVLRSPLAALFRVLCLAVVMGAVWSGLRSPDWRQTWRRLFLGLFAVLLLFPYGLSLWSPLVSSEASWLQAQHEGLTTTAGDIYTSQEYRNLAARQRIYVVNRPIESEIVWLQESGPLSFGWGRVSEVVEWFGLSTWFAAFVRKGWVLALAGSAMILCALFREEAAETRVLMRRFRSAAAFLLAVLAFALVPPLLAGGVLASARRAVQNGDPDRALRRLVLAEKIMPAVREDGNLVIQKGLLEKALGRETPEARCYSALLLENQGFKFQAQRFYVDGLATAPRHSALAREYTKAVLRLATDAMNSGELATAVALFEAVVQADPCNLKANYALQLAHLQRGDLNELRALVRGMEQTYGYFNTATKKAVLANAYEALASCEYLQDDISTAVQTWAQARRP
jgi:energy-coupling factor transporter transmembrane protein EcfT